MKEISEYFSASYGKIKEPFGLMAEGKTPFISSGDTDNGVAGFFDVAPSHKKVISVARTGSVGSAFYHPYSCAVNSDCIVLEPKKNFPDEQMLLFVALLRKNIYRYSYGRKVTPERLLLTKMPNDLKYTKKIDFKKKTKEAAKSFSGRKIAIDTQEMRPFKLVDIFTLERGKCGSAEKLLEKGNEIAYIGAKKDDNGFMYKVVRNEAYVTKGNCIVFIGDGQGSVGYSTYQGNDFIGSTTLSMGRNIHLNRYNALFVVALLDKERFKYSFGRKWNGEKLKNTKIRLPVAIDGNPDWQLMEEYIKSLPYSANI